MKIQNNTYEPLVVALRNLEGFDDREELLEPGQTSEDWLHLEEEDIITIEPSSQPHFVSQVEINEN